MERLSQGRRAGAGAAGVQRGQASSGAHVCTPLLGPATLPCVAVTVGLGEHTVTQAHRTLSLGRAGPMAAHGRAGRGQSGFLWVRAGHWPGPGPRGLPFLPAPEGCSWCWRSRLRALPPPVPDALGPLSGEEGGGWGGQHPFLLVLPEPAGCRAPREVGPPSRPARERPAGWSCVTATCDPSCPFSKPRRGPEGPTASPGVRVPWGGCSAHPGGGFPRTVSFETWCVTGYSEPPRAAVTPGGRVVTGQGPGPRGSRNALGKTEPGVR